MKIRLVISYSQKSTNGDLRLALYKRFVRFKPHVFRKGFKIKPWDEKKYLDALKKASSEDDVSVSDLDFNIYTTGPTGSKVSFDSVNIEQDINVFFPDNSDVEQFIQDKEFVSAYICHSEYVEIQSTRNMNSLLNKNFPEELYESLKDTPYKEGFWGGVEYDIRYNPGRLTLISYTWLLAGWKMWLGNLFFELVPKERILSFPDAYEIRELSNGYVYVQLYEKIEESHSIQNVQIQQKWRDWLGYEKLIETYG